MGDDRAGGVEHHRVSDRALCPAQDGAGFGRIGLRVTAQQLVELGTCEAESRGIESQFVDGARLHPPDRAGGRRGQLVEPVVAVHHQHAGPARGKDPGHHLGEVSERAADQPRPRPGRIRQRPKQIEHRGHADLAAHHRGVPVRRMELRREAKTNPDFLEAAHHLIGIQVDAHPERFQGVGSPRQRRCRPVAVFDHGHTGGGHHDGRHRGQVDRIDPVATGTDDIDGVIRNGVGRHRARVVEHHAGQFGDFLRGGHLHRHRHRERGDLRRPRRAGHDLIHGPGRLAPRQVAPASQATQNLWP
ncbi:hypothetical protein MKAN_02860 [Mycobacterium kansasii ATCC 12478]|uniref:Uncharacterized protein n=1 Tax=Mycobacterium kansasii ATCC 12478 TaxID=557599 RepID=U5WXI8_MYCKA|nr:hypothetical protein MKAN_02860 [Mycobacterium kansasii ATCC 12478]